MYAFLADVMAGLHVGIMAFALFGLIVILIGVGCGWRWIRNPWFRWVHVGLIVVVAVESIFGVTCPLTTWEDQLRTVAGQRVDYRWQPDLVASVVGHAGNVHGGGPWLAAYIMKNGRPAVDRSFIGRLFQDILFYNIPDWIFSVIYIAFAALVLLTFWLAPPRSWRKRAGRTETVPPPGTVAASTASPLLQG